MEVCSLGQSEIEYWYRIKWEKGKGYEGPWNWNTCIMYIYLSPKSRKIPFAAAFWYEQARLDLRMLQ